MWDALYDVAQRRGMTPSALVSEIEEQRGDSSTTGALRVYVLRFYREALREVTVASRPRRARTTSVKRPAQAYVAVM